MSHTHSEDAQDAQDANWTSLASGCKADVSDAPYIFADEWGEKEQQAFDELTKKLTTIQVVILSPSNVTLVAPKYMLHCTNHVCKYFDLLQIWVVV